MGSRSLRGAILSVLSALLVAPAAHAAIGAPVDLGVGQNPNVTVDAGGNAQIGFTGQGANSKELDYCRLPRGATACSPRTVINAPGDSLSKPLVFASGTTVQVISYRYGLTAPYTQFAQVLLFTSTDGGTTFGAGTPIGSISPNDFAFGPGDTVSGITSADACGTCYQAWSLAGGSTGPAGPARD